MVDAHPQVAMAPSMHWIGGYFRRRGVRRPDDPVPRELVLGLAENPRLARFGLSGADLETLALDGRPVRYADLLAWLLEHYRRREGKPRVGSKTATWVRRIGPLHLFWPEARFVHLIRDGRDVCLSIMDWPSAERSLGRLATWREEPVATAALWWERKVRDGREGGRSLPPGLYREQSYERLVANPAAECQALCEFLGLGFDDAMLRFAERGTSGDAELDRAHPWRPITVGLRDWRSQLAAADVELFEAAAGGLLDELGYPRAYPHPGRDAIRRAARVRERLGGVTARPPRTRASGAIEPAASPSPNPYLFIVGCLRSGTTLLRRMADAHPQLAVIHETQWLPRWYRRGVGLTSDGYVTPELAERLFEFRRFADLRIPREAVERLLDANGPIGYARFVSEIFDLYGLAQGKRIVGEKSPGYVRYIPTLHELWPRARIVHLIRDGRNVWLSARNWKKAGRTVGRFSTWGQDPLTTTALWWEWHVRLGREDGAPLGPEGYLEQTYEALVADPGGECAALCEFLELPFDDAMVRYEEGHERRSWGRSLKGSWLPPTPGLRDWRSHMTADELERFEAAAGALLDEVGYERTCPRLSARALARAADARRSFVADARARGRSVPRAWET
jgi:hypothetical protein